jgi:hypothetical protein
MSPPRPRARILLHIGYHKTGTTWLQQRLFRDSDAGFFGVDWNEIDAKAVFVRQDPLCFEPAWARRQFQRELRRAEESNLTFVVSHERLSGHPAGGGYDSRSIADRLVDTFPEARCLICVREQVSMLGSMYAQYVEDGGHLSLKRFLHPPDPYGAVPGFRFDFLRYDRLIAYYQGKLGADNVLVLPFEQFRERPQEFVDRITGFCGAGRHVCGSAKVINPQRNPAYLLAKRIVNLLFTRSQLCNFSWINVPYLRTGFILTAPAFNLVCPRGLARPLQERLARKIRQEIGGRYQESNRRSSALIGVDLGAFGYDVPDSAPAEMPAGDLMPERVTGRRDPAVEFVVHHPRLRALLEWWLSGPRVTPRPPAVEGPPDSRAGDASHASTRSPNDEARTPLPSSRPGS